MNNRRETWVFVEQEDCEISPVSLELLGKAQELATATTIKRVWGKRETSAE